MMSEVAKRLRPKEKIFRLHKIHFQAQIEAVLPPWFHGNRFFIPNAIN